MKTRIFAILLFALLIGVNVSFFNQFIVNKEALSEDLRREYFREQAYYQMLYENESIDNADASTIQQPPLLIGIAIKKFIAKDNYDFLNDILKDFTEQEARFVRLLYGHTDGNARTLEELENLLDITPERTRQIELKFLEEVFYRLKKSYEDDPGSLPISGDLSSNQNVVRILFAKSDSGWVTLDSEKAAVGYDFDELSWFVTYKGENIGTLDTIDDLNSYDDTFPWTYSRTKMYRITNSVGFPAIDHNKDFRAWHNGPNFSHPLVVLTKNNYKDPDQWVQYNAPSYVLTRLVSEFKKNTYWDLYKCTAPPNQKFLDLDPTAADLEIYRSYKNNRNQFLIQIRIRSDYVRHCQENFGIRNHTFFINENNDIRFVGHDYELVDAGDYDNDAEVEFIFYVRGYDYLGLDLYESDFKRKYQFRWGWGGG